MKEYNKRNPCNLDNSIRCYNISIKLSRTYIVRNSRNASIEAQVVKEIVPHYVRFAGPFYDD